MGKPHLWRSRRSWPRREQTSRSTITRWKETGSVQDRPQIGQTKAILLSHYCLIDEAMAENHELIDLKKQLSEKFGEEQAAYSERTIHVLAGISKREAISLVMFQGIITATRYEDILSTSLIPFLQKTYPDAHRLYEDNDPKHTSRYVQAFFVSNQINWWKSPAEIPDLNPIEKMCGIDEEFLEGKAQAPEHARAEGRY